MVWRTVIADPCISIALVRNNGSVRVVLAGPKTRPYHTLLPSGYACTTIRLKPGVFLKSFPTQKLIDNSFTLPVDSESRFWIEGTHLQFPDFEHVELLIGQLHDLECLGYEMPSGSHAQTTDHLSLRTHARRVRRSTGLSPYKLYQLRRMHQVLRLLKRGVSAAEVASELAFVDQSHLIRASRQFLGHTPKQLASLPQTP